MAKYGSGSVGWFLVDGYDLKGVQTDFSCDVEGLFEETTALGDTWQAHTPTGIRRADMAQNGWFDDDSASVNAALNSLQTTSRIVGFSLAGNTIGQKATGIQGAYGSKWTRKLERGGLVKASATYTVSGQVDEGVILQSLATQTADWNTESTSVDNAASSSGGWVAYLWVKSLTLGGHTGLAIKIRDSADNASWADLSSGAFTTVTTAPTAQRISAASGTVRRYTAISADFTGAGSPSAEVVVVLVRG